MASVTVVVPSYRRPDDLARCLSGLAAQEPAPHETLVVLREDDLECRSVATEQGGTVRIVDVEKGVSEFAAKEKAAAAPRFDIARSASLSDAQRARLLEALGPELRVACDESRSQARNRDRRRSSARAASGRRKSTVLSSRP